MFMSDPRTKCHTCDGRGKVRGLLSILRSCPDCDGTGQIPNVVPSGQDRVRLQRMVRDLAETWERRLAEKSGATRDALDCGRTIQLRECCDELRAELGKIQNDEALQRREEKP